MEITITKTIQSKQFEPLTVTVTESAPVNTNEDYEQLKAKVGACVADILATELKRYCNTGASKPTLRTQQ